MNNNEIPQDNQLRNIIEAALLAAGQPMNVDQLRALFDEQTMPEKETIKGVLQSLETDYLERGIELAQVASGWRIQVREQMRPWVSRLWSERPGKYSRALLETLAIIAYRQPVTRGEIEEIRGVSVSTTIIKTLLERGWVRVVGHRDVPGKPGMYGTTREFLDYFNLQRLDDLPSLMELRDLSEIEPEMSLPLADEEADD